MLKYLIISLSIILVQNCYAAKIYKWKDENGVTQFSTSPPLDVNQKKSTVGSSQKKINKPIKDAVKAKWKLTYNDGMHSSVDIRKKYIRFYHKKDRKTRSESKSGNYVISGKILEVKYKSHDDKAMIGKKERFIIKKVTDDELTLVWVGKGKTVTYLKDAFGKSSKSLTSKAKQLIGTWMSDIYDRKITFVGSDFYVEEKPYDYRPTYRKILKGSWQYKNPYIVFNIKNKREEGRSGFDNANIKMKFYILNKSAAKLKVRNEFNKVEEFTKENKF